MKTLPMMRCVQPESCPGFAPAGAAVARSWGKRVLLLLLGLAPLLPAQGGVLPAGVYPLSQLAAAQGEATKSGKAVAFVLSQLKGTGAKAATPNTQYAFTKLSSVCVPVYVDYLDDLKALAEKQPLVGRALASEQAGKTIPRTVVTDPEARRVLAIISTMPEGVMGDGVYEDACRQIQDYLKHPEQQVHFDAAKKGKGRKKG